MEFPLSLDFLFIFKIFQETPKLIVDKTLTRVNLLRILMKQNFGFFFFKFYCLLLILNYFTIEVEFDFNM